VRRRGEEGEWREMRRRRCRGKWDVLRDSLKERGEV